MKNHIEITFEGEYIKFLSDGEKDLAFVSRLWRQIAEACQKHSCFKVLGIANTTLPINTMDAFDHVDLFKNLGLTSKYRIAWVELNPKHIAVSSLVDTVLFNRGLPGRLFATESEAKEWLFNDSYGQESSERNSTRELSIRH